MFKKNSSENHSNAGQKSIPPGAFLLTLLLFIAAGCRTTPLLPPANLSAPGWKSFQGQAIWRAKRGAPEIAGELLLATNSNRQTFVQFSKNPFPLAIAQSTTNIWQIESPTQNRTFAGHGLPPARVIWFQLPRAVAGSPLPKRWSWKQTPDSWHLENLSSGEMLDGYLTSQ